MSADECVPDQEVLGGWVLKEAAKVTDQVAIDVEEWEGTEIVDGWKNVVRDDVAATMYTVGGKICEFVS